MEQDITDLAAWLGKPTAKPPTPVRSADQNSQSAEDDTPQVINMSSGTPSGRNTSSEDELQSYGDTMQGSLGKGMPARVSPSKSLTSNSSSGTILPQTRETLRIEVPKLTEQDKENFKYLPGHFTIRSVIAEIKQEKYRVKLESGEIQILRKQDFRDFENGKEAFVNFRNDKTGVRNRRTPSKPKNTGMVNWATLNLSDVESEDDLAFVAEQPSQNYIDNADEDDDSAGEEELTDDSQTLGRRSTRLAGRRRTALYRAELLETDDSDDAQLSGRRSRVLGRRSTKSRRATETVGARRSERTRTRPRRSMRERQEDEISSHSEEEVGPKIVTTKEIFPKLPESDPFRRRHRQDCDVCTYSGDSGSKGPLVFCQGCTLTYHKQCLGHRGTRDHLVTKIGEDLFVLQCRRCIGTAHDKDNTAPHQGCCTACNEPGPDSKPFRGRLTTRQEQLQREENSGRDLITFVKPELINNVSNVMFRCEKCQRAWHMHHLPDRQTVSSQMDADDDQDLDQQQLAQKRFDLYHRSWLCKDCIENKQLIDTLVAWRPVDQDSYIPGVTVDMMEETKKEYLIKWRSQSYLRATWMPGSWVWGTAAQSMRAAFMKKPENSLPKMTTKDAIPEDFYRIDIVFDVRYNSVVRNSTKEIDLARIKEVDSAFVKYKGLGYEDAIWEKPPVYTDIERFNDFRTAYEDYVTKVYMYTPSHSTLRRRMIEVRNHDFDRWTKKEQPSIMTGGQLMQYQLEGLNWLYYQWYRNQNAILADEMGLGKTIQLIAFFATLIQDHKCWPFLIVVPNSTCPNWRREIKKWAPSLRAVTYYGSEKARKLTHDFELFPKDKDEVDADKKSKSEVREIRAHIVITSYESVVEEKVRRSLMKVPWQGLVVDEGQRLKNDKNLVYESLSKYRFPFKALLTGTPLQNNARELFNLIQFLDRNHSATELEAKYSVLTPEMVPELHELLRPFFLRRTKVQVLTFLPPMAQIIVPVTMSTVQKKVYKSILAKNPHLMKSIFSREGGALAQKDRANLSNMLMQLRKTLCHPFVYSREIEERTADTEVSHRNLVEASSKLQLLSIMLPKLQERGHRVLMFSQFLDNLDIIEDFLDGLGMLHRRLDGTINASEKQKRIDEFNAPGSPYFAFLLSTRAGGVGINLATADTVIILDPDWNPHQDIQALSRAHRIGQQNKVLVFQLMTRNSAEEKIMQIGKKKMALDHVLIERMDQEDDAAENLESVLKFGAQALFEDSADENIIYDSTSVDKLLDRSQMESTKTSDDKSAESQFSFARIWANDKASLEDGLHDTNETGPGTPNPDIWDKILAEREKAYQEEMARKEETLGRGKRKREKIDYHDHGFRKLSKRLPGDESSDGEFEAASPGKEDANDSSEENSEFEEPPTIRARPFRRVKIPVGEAPYFNGDGPANYIPGGEINLKHSCRACSETHSLGWCRLKLAGVEYCGLCGLAHIGHGRTCPHLNDEKRVETLLATLKESTESRDMVEEATKYLRLIRSDMISRRRAQEKQEQDLASKARYGVNGNSGALRNANMPGIGNFSLGPRYYGPFGL